LYISIKGVKRLIDFSLKEVPKRIQMDVYLSRRDAAKQKILPGKSHNERGGAKPKDLFSWEYHKATT
jgi:hypothetical protein